MARPQKDGLDYFPLDVDIDQDDKIQLIEAEFGLTGFGIVIKLFMKIYKEGYFYEWTEKEQLLFSKRVNVDINQVNDVINTCIKWGLFDKNIFEKYGVLTSKGIQKRYLEATSRRKRVSIIKEYCLIDHSEYSNIVFVDINGVNVNINPNSDGVNDVNNPQSKVKKSKVKYSTSSSSSIHSTVQGTAEAETEVNRKDDKDDDDDKNPYTFYEENFGTISPFTAEKIKELENSIGPRMVVEAMKIAVLNRARGMGYVEAIIRDWLDHNIRDPSQLEAYERIRKNKSSLAELEGSKEISEKDIKNAATYIKLQLKAFKEKNGHPTEDELKKFLNSDRFNYPNELKKRVMKALGYEKYLDGG